MPLKDPKEADTRRGSGLQDMPERVPVPQRRQLPAESNRFAVTQTS